MTVAERSAVTTTPLDRHARAALCFSGGKDSLACVYLVGPFLDRITVYHVDTGDLLPETETLVSQVQAFVPHFVRLETDVAAWIAGNGLPSDLVPYSSHPIGQALGQAGRRIVPRYDCCWANIMWPLFARIQADGHTLVIRGVKAADFPRLPVTSGAVIGDLEIWHPVQDWTDHDVFSFLAKQEVPLPRIYDYVDSGPDCARCSAWWSEQRGAYLHRFHPELWREYDARLRVIAAEIAAPLALLEREMAS